MKGASECTMGSAMSEHPLKFDAHGLIPVVVVDHLTGEVRMQAFANQEAIARTLQSGKATFFSRSRVELWEKGQTSGNAIRVLDVLVDCDGDALLYVSDPSGNSCHTGARTCFYRAFGRPGGQPLPSVEEDDAPPQTVLAGLEQVLEARKSSTGESSYTKSLYDGAPATIGAKLREEGAELAQALEGETDERVISEAADVLYHLMVGLRWRSIPLRRVMGELARRMGKSGHAEKSAR
jgi:phosphoribosyl-AMP cyclohydrolase / phosphoribosyl-ATP pyrophosphohydrolase